MSQKRDFQSLDNLYSMGDTCKICGVTSRALRYYEELDLVSPDWVNEENGFRFYTIMTMERIQTIRYYHEQGFQLNTIREMLKPTGIDQYISFFEAQIDRASEEADLSARKVYNLKVCKTMLLEAKLALDHRNMAVGVKYVPPIRCLCSHIKANTKEELNQAYIRKMAYLSFGNRPDDMPMINLLGTWYLVYEDLKRRMEKTAKEVTMWMPVYPHEQESDSEDRLGNFTAIYCYHIGAFDRIGETYQRMLQWAKDHRFALTGQAIEKPLWDAYEGHEEQQVVELLLPTDASTAEISQLNHLQNELEVF